MIIFDWIVRMAMLYACLDIWFLAYRRAKLPRSDVNGAQWFILVFFPIVVYLITFF